MLVVGLTGGIGCGKSLVSNLFEQQFGTPIIDADIIAREISETSHVIQLIQNSFGKEFFDKDQALIRSRLREVIFSNSKLRKKLEDIIHPLVYDEIERRLESNSGEYCIVVIPLLLEKKKTHFIDRILLVDCTVEQQILRVTQRDQCDESHVRAIISTQLSREKRLDLADDVIDNSGNIKSVSKNISILHEKYIELNRSKL